MITKQALVEAGYKHFTQRNIKAFTNEFYQKRFDDENGKKYFITVAVYDNRELNHPALPEFSFEPDVQFESNGVTFNATMLSPESVQHMEEFFERLWVSMNCDHYE